MDGQCDYYMPPKVPLGALKVELAKLFYFDTHVVGGGGGAR